MAAGAGGSLPDPLKVISLIGVNGNAIIFDPSKQRGGGKLINLNVALAEFLADLERKLSRRHIGVSHHLFTAQQLSVTLQHLFYDYNNGQESFSDSLALLGNIKDAFEKAGLTFGKPDILHCWDVLRGRDLGDTYNSDKIARQEWVNHELATDYCYSEHHSLEVISNGEEMRNFMQALADLNIADIANLFEQLYAREIEVASSGIFFKYLEQDEELKKQLGTEKEGEDPRQALLIKILKEYGTENVIYLWTSNQKELYDQILKDTETKITTEKGEELLANVIARRVVFIEQEGTKQRSLEEYYALLKASIEKNIKKYGLEEGFNRIFEEVPVVKERRSEIGLTLPGSIVRTSSDPTSSVTPMLFPQAVRKVRSLGDFNPAALGITDSDTDSRASSRASNRSSGNESGDTPTGYLKWVKGSGQETAEPPRISDKENEEDVTAGIR